MRENKICEVCNKEKDDVRFEGWNEKYICDICLDSEKKETKCKECNSCGGEMVAGFSFSEEDEVCFMKCKVCGDINEESLVYG